MNGAVDPADGRPLADRVGVVTGASRGLGAAVARALAKAGARVVLAARDERALRAVADRIDADGGQALVVPTDVGSAASVRRLVEQTCGAFGRLDVAMNNAASGGAPPTPLAELAVEDYDAAIAVSLRGVFLALKYEIPAMLAGGGGAVVNMASTASMWPVAGMAGYVASKCGVVGLTRTAALDYADAGIRVNALAPGPIRTERVRAQGAEVERHIAAGVPAGRLGRPDEVAAAAVWLCSPAAAFVTGATLPVDGGMLAGMAPFGRPQQPGGGAG